jgi:hypothetical protein
MREKLEQAQRALQERVLAVEQAKRNLQAEEVKLELARWDFSRAVREYADSVGLPAFVLSPYYRYEESPEPQAVSET